MNAEIVVRFLRTGLTLQRRGEVELAQSMLGHVPAELAARNRLMEQRLYPVLAEGPALSSSNRRLESLAHAALWEPLLAALEGHLRQEAHSLALARLCNGAD